ncbi:MAG: accessory factor UbiK family protein [Gammaproteobacteria bacterium]|nr:accessory factor UbiK family protein [Gammaproteobacteria bacterium]
MNTPFKRITESIQDVLPGDIAEEVRSNLKTLVEASLQKMNLVTREELLVQEKVLARTREQLELLAARVEALEKDRDS